MRLAIAILKVATERWRDELPGGLADDKTPEDFPKKLVEEGARIESEHTSDPHLQKEVAIDHLVEHRDYYKRLKKSKL